MAAVLHAKDIRPRRTPSQSRSAAMVNLILDAAASILEADGLERFNTNAVAQRAGVSVGSIYQYFPRKEALTAALVFRAHEDIVSALRDLLGRPRANSPADAVRAFVALVYDLHSSHPRLSEILEYEEWRLPHTLELARVEEEIGELVEAYLRHNVLAGQPVSPEQFESLSFDVIAITRGMIDAAWGASSRLKQDLVARVAAAVQGYLAVRLAG